MCPPSSVQRRVPDIAGRGRVGEVAGDQAVAAPRGMSDDMMTALLEQRIGRSADPAAGSRDEDVHGCGLALGEPVANRAHGSQAFSPRSPFASFP